MTRSGAVRRCSRRVRGASPTRLTSSALSAAGGRVPPELVLHIGSAAVPVAVRAIGPRHVRLRLLWSLPLQVGDRALLRDPGMRRVLSGVVVLDPAPPPLTGRGAAKSRARNWPGPAGVPDVRRGGRAPRSGLAGPARSARRHLGRAAAGGRRRSRLGHSRTRVADLAERARTHGLGR